MIDTDKTIDRLIEPQTIDPRTKIVFLITQLVILFTSESLWYHSYLIVLSLILIISIKFPLKTLLKIALAFLFFSFLGIFFLHQKQTLDELILLFYLFFNRFITSFCLITWFFQTVSTNELSIVMNKMYIPQKLTTIFTSLYQLIPLFTKEISILNHSRRIKGFVSPSWNVINQFSILKKMLKTVFIRAINNSILFAETLVIKGYNPSIKRKYSISRRFRIKDFFISSVSIAICVLSFYFF
ncbi:MAG: energy-coupling factor transporter transmembrane protein EcfT [Candidatus Heimdallarchaeum aukensis]|uniref:Energy-coupling factor transporter transmembrane protein EcfT n=1 Tax=Candidatus Heimdallarchaeum aukensis TaxID=2876573 RepID=A0A9Y1BI81_9ARCH|nr:MAG: energy-coupling factor transporter transmembrane protein EcfT [Candidatus Heimdallarchaeum aukensis]